MDGRIYRCAEVFSLFGCGDFWASWGMEGVGNGGSVVSGSCVGNGGIVGSGSSVGSGSCVGNGGIVGSGSSVGSGRCVGNGSIVEMVERGDWE